MQTLHDANATGFIHVRDVSFRTHTCTPESALAEEDQEPDLYGRFAGPTALSDQGLRGSRLAGTRLRQHRR